MNKFHMGWIDFTYANKDGLVNEKIPEFLIDDQSLIELLGDYRHLGNYDNDLNSDGVLSHHYILQLLGRSSNNNQLGSNRTVLYRCHCACDHCGIFSTEIIVGKLTVQWKLIAWEDQENQTIFDQTTNLKFFKHQYFKAIEQYCEQKGIVL